MALAELINATRRWGPMFSIKGCSYGFQGGAPEAAIPPEKQLQRLEAGGAKPQDLAVALMDAFQIHFPEFRGLGCGFRRPEQLSPRDPKMGLWALTVFKDGWRVLDHLGTTPEGLLLFLLSRWPPCSWLGDAVLLRIPPAFLAHIEPGKLVFDPQDRPLDLRWVPGGLACGLSIMGPIPGLSLPKTLSCAGDIHIENVHELMATRDLNAPGHGLTLKACPDLQSIDLPERTALLVDSCPQLKHVQGKVTGDLHVENCPELTHMDIVLPRDAHPAPSLIIRNCPTLHTIGCLSGVRRTCKDLILENCPVLSTIHPDLIVRGERRITASPLVSERT